MTGVTHVCLYIILLVNNFHYWLVGSKKTTFFCKTFLCRTREITLSWRLLFFILMRNDFVIKTIYCPVLSICVYICVSCMCIYMLCVYVVSCFTCNYWDWQLPCHILSPVLRFNKADWIYLRYLHVGGCCTVIGLSYCTVYLLGLRIDIYKYIYIER